MNKTRFRDKDARRQATARQLHDAIEEHSSESFNRMTEIAGHIKTAHPELAGRVDLIIGRSMIRSILMPDAMTELFLAQTKEPPTIIEGEMDKAATATEDVSAGEATDE
jgi:hypothetical protein